jgi:hypothetical protein
MTTSDDHLVRRVLSERLPELEPVLRRIEADLGDALGDLGALMELAAYLEGLLEAHLEGADADLPLARVGDVLEELVATAGVEPVDVAFGVFEQLDDTSRGALRPWLGPLAEALLDALEDDLLEPGMAWRPRP